MVIRLELAVERGEHVLVGIQYLPALTADQVNVRPVLVSGIIHPAFAQVNTAGKPLFHQQFERAVNRGDIHRSGSFLDQGENFIGVNMITLVGDGFNNHLALRGDAKPV
jgi:hypothetical protein